MNTKFSSPHLVSVTQVSLKWKRHRVSHEIWEWWCLQIRCRRTFPAMPIVFQSLGLNHNRHSQLHRQSSMGETHEAIQCRRTFPAMPIMFQSLGLNCDRHLQQSSMGETHNVLILWNQPTPSYMYILVQNNWLRANECPMKMMNVYS